MEQSDLIPHLFRTEYRKIVAVLCKLFGIDHIETAEDIVSNTFLQASELWGLKGPPPNPTAWLYAAAKNKTIDYLRRHANFAQNISKELKHLNFPSEEIEVDLSDKNITDSQLAMIFVICHPCNPAEAQIGLALNLLCGFGVDEIAQAFLTNREVIYKRLQRAKEKLRIEKIKIESPELTGIDNRISSVLMTLYLLFNEGYYSASQDVTLRRELCMEAMRLTYLLTEYPQTDKPEVNALLSLMCFHASRFDARLGQHGETILYHDQDSDRWNQELIAKGEYFLNLASRGSKLSKFHLEAAIAYWHTIREDTEEKWENILQLYNELLFLEYSPIAALNRTYALSKANGKAEAIAEAEKINLKDNHLYHSLLGALYHGVDNEKALHHLQQAMALAKSASDKSIIAHKISRL
ncbi:sigma-70 family RNA polymerase sigma factor [Fulvivirgaceae bacterium PWU4]|uniref:Sigma-70 family RNA polymerase sigma factor n=1 Tax=Chryseosolibacter histidini TaxID=2782349 RepID=A0AAP2DJS3_9BACT|nr:sigma-70 family RNA polymerase sigma factor [Chryseosolibacter histidini]MBT1696658.1 sigma-70 family RNA polymerase sigma factor [Chryseosolibacter histidini]